VKAVEKPNGVFSVKIKTGERKGQLMDMFVYRIVDATQTELNAYSQFLASQGYKLQHCEETGLPLYMHPGHVGVNIEVTVSPTTGRAYVVNFEERKLRSIARKNGIEAEVRSEMAKQIAEVASKSIIANMFASRASIPVNALKQTPADDNTPVNNDPIEQNEPVDENAGDGSAPF
jgi:hypothetical protein